MAKFIWLKKLRTPTIQNQHQNLKLIQFPSRKCHIISEVITSQMLMLHHFQHNKNVTKCCIGRNMTHVYILCIY